MKESGQGQVAPLHFPKQALGSKKEGALSEPHSWQKCGQNVMPGAASSTGVLQPAPLLLQGRVRSRVL